MAAFLRVPDQTFTMGLFTPSVQHVSMLLSHQDAWLPIENPKPAIEHA
jgi:hypothetical protein